MLKAKQLRFVEEYAIDHNGAAAATRAGYSARSARVTASQLLTIPDVRAAVQAKQSEVAQRLEMTRDRIVQELQAAIELARVQGDAAAMIRGWCEIGKICGLYAPERKQVHVSASVLQKREELEAMTDEELLAIAAGAVSE